MEKLEREWADNSTGSKRGKAARGEDKSNKCGDGESILAQLLV